MSVSIQVQERTIELRAGARVLDALLAAGIEAMQICGGRGLCATCHVVVLAGSTHLSDVSEREARTIKRNANTGPTSRLACQARVLSSGAKVKPAGRYIREIRDLDALIGRRTREPILHPVDGRVLIQAKKIITRTAIAPLRSENFNIDELDLQD